jgi:hypothetical protein
MHSFVVDQENNENPRLLFEFSAEKYTWMMESMV